MTEGVPAADLLEAIVRYSPTELLPYTPSGTFGATSPYTPGGKLRSTGLVPLRKALSCLQRVAPKGPGVEGTRCDFQKRPELRGTPHPPWAKAHDTFSPGRRLFSETAIPYF